MEEITVIWGKFWTYLLLCLIVLSGGIIAFYLSEARRDADAKTFYDAGRTNNDQWIDIYKYVYENDDLSKDSIIKYISKIRVIRTRAEMELIQKQKDAAEYANDNNYAVVMDTVCFDVMVDSVLTGQCFKNTGLNDWNIPDVTSVFDEKETTEIWGSTGGADIDISKDDSNGFYSLWVRPGFADKSFAGTRLILDPGFAYEMYIDAKQIGSGGYVQLLDYDGDSIYTEIKRFDLSGSGFKTYKEKIDPGKKYISVLAGWNSAGSGKTVLIDNIRLYRYEKININ